MYEIEDQVNELLYIIVLLSDIFEVLIHTDVFWKTKSQGMKFTQVKGLGIIVLTN